MFNFPVLNVDDYLDNLGHIKHLGAISPYDAILNNLPRIIPRTEASLYVEGFYRHAFCFTPLGG